MMKPSKAQAKKFVQEGLDEIPALKPFRASSPEFIKWHRNTRIAINNIFGENSDNANEFGGIRYHSIVVDERANADACQHGLVRANAILESMVNEIDTWWADDDETSPDADVLDDIGASVSNQVFVVHGRDEAAKQMVARYLEGLDLKPIILQEQPSGGQTIIEKFEGYAQKAGFAVILGTPDDVGGLSGDQDKLQPRMRQNVVFELGYFTHALGRKRVCVLLKGDVERPSDYDGVIYIPLDDSEGWKLRLATELKASGLPIDMNRLVEL